MQYSPRLKKIMAQIDAIMKKNDVGGLVILHEPGFAEVNISVTPGYSCAKVAPDGGLILRAVADELPGGMEQRRALITQTANMFELLSECTAKSFMMFDKVNEQLKPFVIHKDGGFSDLVMQSN